MAGGGIIVTQPVDVAAIVAAIAAGSSSPVRIWDGTTIVDVIAAINSFKIDQSSIAGTVTAVNAGNVSAGVQRVTIATDDVNLALQTADIARLSAAIAAHLAAGPANALLTGALAVNGVPAAEAAGDIAAPWMDLFRRLVLYGSDIAQGALSVSDIAPAQMQKLFETGWAALTAPGQLSPILNVQDYENITFSNIIAIGGCTSVDVILWGSLDGTNFFQMGTTQQYTASGTYAVTFSGVAVRYVRTELDAEAGDTDCTVTPQIAAGN